MNGETGPIAAASALEILTGAALVVDPSLLARLLFGQGLDETGTMVGRTAGLVLVCLAIGCWPRLTPAERSSTPLEPLLLMSVLVSVYLIYLGVTGLAYGLLLWPAVLTHLLITVFLARAWVKRRGVAVSGARG
ncbi:MAG: hypothetical protein ACLQF1_15625 [Methyloceanibacter sp.]